MKQTPEKLAPEDFQKWDVSVQAGMVPFDYLAKHPHKTLDQAFVSRYEEILEVGCRNYHEVQEVVYVVVVTYGATVKDCKSSDPYYTGHAHSPWIKGVRDVVHVSHASMHGCTMRRGAGLHNRGRDRLAQAPTAPPGLREDPYEEEGWAPRVPEGWSGVSAEG
jgi:hypothetical protein